MDVQTRLKRRTTGSDLFLGAELVDGSYGAHSIHLGAKSSETQSNVRSGVNVGRKGGAFLGRVLTPPKKHKATQVCVGGGGESKFWGGFAGVAPN